MGADCENNQFSNRMRAVRPFSFPPSPPRPSPDAYSIVRLMIDVAPQCGASKCVILSPTANGEFKVNRKLFELNRRELFPARGEI